MKGQQPFLATRRPIGQRRTRLVLEKPTETADGVGGTFRTYATVASFWASLQMRGSDPGQGPEQEGATLTFWISIAYRSDVDTAWRLRSGTRIFIIRGLSDPDEKRRTLICICEEERP